MHFILKLTLVMMDSSFFDSFGVTQVHPCLFLHYHINPFPMHAGSTQIVFRFPCE